MPNDFNQIMTDRNDSGALRRAITTEEGFLANNKQVDFASLLINMNNKELDSNGQASSNINSPAMG